MKLSTRGRYGLRMMIDLYIHQETETIPLAEIANRQHISTAYLERIASDLKRSGYLRSVKGQYGGYQLAQNPAKIQVGDLLRILEGDIRITDDYIEDESILQECLREQVYDVLNDRLSNLVDDVSLADLCTNTLL